MKDKNYYSPKELAEAEHVTVQTVYNWFKRGLIKTKIGGKTKIMKADVEKFQTRE